MGSLPVAPGHGSDPRRVDQLAFLAGGGEMGARIRAHDWAASSLGPPAQWPQALRVAIGICLNSSVPTAIYWGPDLRLLYNDAWAPIPAHRHPWALGRPAAEVWTDIWHVIEPQFRQVLASGMGVSTYDQMLPMERDGIVQETYWNYSFTPLHDEHGDIVGIFNQGHETTQQVITQRALRESQERLELALGASNSVGTWDWHLETDQVTADARFANLYGVDAARAARGVPLAEFLVNVHPDDAARIRAGIERALRERAGFAEEYRVLQPDGSCRWVIAQGRPWYGADGRASRFPGVSYDVTALKEAQLAEVQLAAELRAAQAALQDLNTQLLATVEQRTEERDRIWRVSRDVLGVADASGTWQAVNPAWTRVLGWADHELVGRTFDWLLGEGERTTAEILATLNARGETTFENRLRTRAGELRALAWTLVAHEGELYAVARDVTEQREREAALVRAEEQLRQSQKMEAVGHLTGGIAHDFNNLLNGIAGWLAVLQLRVSQGRLEDLDRYIGLARNAARRAATLTHRLLAFSRQQTLAPRAVSIERLVRDMEDLIRRSVGPSVRLDTRFVPGTWPALVDPNQLENALLNLCINARDAMPEGGAIEVRTANRLLDDRDAVALHVAPGAYLELSVTDTGVGMTPEVLSRAFDPFFTTKPAGRGTGLGLSMVYGFAQQSGGTVHITSEVGAGTTVALFLPRHEGEVDEPDAPSAQQAPRHGGIGYTVLIVDDEPTVRLLVAEILRDYGYTTIEAADAAGALPVLRSNTRIDVLVTDVGLPGGLNGAGLAAAARSVRPDLRVVFITGYADHAPLDTGLPSRTAIVRKPFEPDALALHVHELIANA